MVFPHPHYKAVDVSTAQSGEEPKTFFGQNNTLIALLVLMVNMRTLLSQNHHMVHMVHLTERANNAKVRSAEQRPSLAA